MQHGPLVSFHQYLNQGIALCKYTTREEANKAQMALNNCVLGNTTIFAESPSETEVQNILQHLPQQAQSSVNSVISSNGSTGGGGGSGSGNGSGNSSNVSSSNVNATSNAASSSNANVNNNTNGNNGPNIAGGVASGGTVNAGSISTAVSVGNNAAVGSNTNNINSAVTSVNSVVHNAAKNASVGSNIAMTAGGGQANVSNVSTVAAGNNSSWRQTQTQSQALQGQNRPAGREADYDYISQFVCSIVDD